ncbi:hypothetical protein TIFTF001_046201 [Ficus carica]|uniref:Uncharacterized protein n=1 Tax=Ficus carica TaxID=3494 RepID=A0AA88CSM3_FICCA|nr:hypothetical protein TIFTF001_046198 [Ficus carica]GMN28047.1 hypothetical protein TIFTF001_046199 [Ficus carica]GMN28063.1 hypothetical protein TIFTF001_046200 [Ficus carica]GMN28078.1 hypothetical protein TIFTF001_046201 [Ficus carica]
MENPLATPSIIGYGAAPTALAPPVIATRPKQWRSPTRCRTKVARLSRSDLPPNANNDFGSFFSTAAATAAVSPKIRDSPERSWWRRRGGGVAYLAMAAGDLGKAT